MNRITWFRGNLSYIIRKDKKQNMTTKQKINCYNLVYPWGTSKDNGIILCNICNVSFVTSHRGQLQHIIPHFQLPCRIQHDFSLGMPEAQTLTNEEVR